MAVIDLEFGVDTSVSSGNIKDQLAGIIREIEPLKVKTEIEIDASDKRWANKIEKLIKNSGDINIKVNKVDASGALVDFKSQLEKIVNSISIDKGVDISVKMPDLGEIKTDLDRIGDSAKDSATDIDRLTAEMKELMLQAGSIRSAYKSVTNTTERSVNGVNISEITSKYTELQQEIEAMNRVGATSANSHIEKVRELEAAMRSLLNQAKSADKVNLVPGSTDSEKALTKVRNLLAEITRIQREWSAAVNGVSSDAYARLSDYVKELNNLKDSLSSGNISKSDFNLSFDSISAGVGTAKKEIRAAGEATRSWSDHFGDLSKKFASWLSATQVVSAIWNMMKKMVSSVIEIDSAMTELKKVTDATDATYDRFLTNAASRAKEVGATISDVVNSTADFARLGYSIDEASTLADTAIVYKNVADGISDISEASESIISTMKAFDIEAENSMTIADKYNEVSNRFAISSSGIGEAMQRSASALSTANNSIDESIALITAANSVVQDEEKVGK